MRLPGNPRLASLWLLLPLLALGAGLYTAQPHLKGSLLSSAPYALLGVAAAVALSTLNIRVRAALGGLRTLVTALIVGAVLFFLGRLAGGLL